MKTQMNTLLAAFLFLAPTLQLSAQDFECKPLTCTIKDGGDYKVELAGCCNTMDIYVYDNNLKPVRGTALTGYVDFFYSSEPPLKAPLVQYHHTNAMSARIVAPGFNYCRVTLTIGGKIESVYFDNECELRAEVPNQRPPDNYRE